MIELHNKVMADFTLLTFSLTCLLTCVEAYYRGGPIWGNNFGIPGQNATYDYVIVGGGTAGLALATRLAEDTSLTVAVIEAGGFYEEDYGNNSVVPGLGLICKTDMCYGLGRLLTCEPDDATTTLYTNAFPAVDWGIDTTLQTGLNNQTFHYWRGRTLGGT